MTAISDVIERWEAKRGEFARYSAQVDGAALVTEMLADLESLAACETAVSLSVAAAQSGYCADYLSRLIREGKLTNYGRKHAPRVRLSECPTKPRLAVSSQKSYDPRADARSLVSSRR